MASQIFKQNIRYLYLCIFWFKRLNGSWIQSDDIIKSFVVYGSTSLNFRNILWARIHLCVTCEGWRVWMVVVCGFCKRIILNQIQNKLMFFFFWLVQRSQTRQQTRLYWCLNDHFMWRYCRNIINIIMQLLAFVRRQNKKDHQNINIQIYSIEIMNIIIIHNLRSVVKLKDEKFCLKNVKYWL